MKTVPMPWKILYGEDQEFDCAAFLNSGDTCDLANIEERGYCHPSASWLLFGDPHDSHNPRFCATHYFSGLGDGTQFDDYRLAPIEIEGQKESPSQNERI